MPLSGKAVIVTGGAGGIGATYARALAAAGARVVIADVLEQEGEALAGELKAARAVFVGTDVTRQADADRMARETAERFGAIDVLINNAALYGDLGRKKPFEEIPEDEWDAVMTINVRGIWQCVKAVAPYMRRQGRGKIINISSSTIYSGTPGLAHYVASKAAVVGLTRVLARELGPLNICVNAITPGLVSDAASERLNPKKEYFERAADQRPLRRMMRPDDLVGTVMFLASPASDFVTGQTISVNGGSVMV